MAAAFLKLLNMSIAAGWLVLAIVLLRIILKKAPKWIRCILWAFVAIRLIWPFPFESVLSVIPSAETVPQDIMYVQEPTIHTGISILNSSVNPVLSENLAPAAGDSVNPMQIVTYIAAIIWMVGLIAMIIYAAFSYIRIHKKVAASMNLKDNLYICDYIDTPFILGIIMPGIYIPSALEGDKVAYVIAHEKAHLRRHDHWWKPLGFTLLSVYWFNPLIWIAYVLLCRDIELACDERVIKELGEADKKSYSEALLFCSIPRKMIVACPLAFGEVGVKERVRSILNYKKPAFWFVVVAVAACIIVAICFLTNPKEEQLHAPEQNQVVFGAEYVSSKCLYMSMLSSLSPSDDSGDIYRMESDAFVIINRSTGDETRLAVEKWEWQEFPYTDEEWNEMILARYEGEPSNIGTLYEEMLYQPLSARYSLAKMDEELWLVKISQEPNGHKRIWSIYSLVPEGSMGSSQWEFRPWLSSQYPAFPIAFDMEDVEITAYCTSGALIDYENDGEEYPYGTVITIPAGGSLYWSPGSYDETVVYETKTEIRFWVKKDEVTLYSGTIYITGGKGDSESSFYTYTASLVGGNMVMKQNEETAGAVISATNENSK